MTSETKSAPTEMEQELIRLLPASAQNAPGLGPDTAFIADLGLESVQVIEYLCEVEDRFDVIIDEDSLADVQTVADLAAVVERIRAA